MAAKSKTPPPSSIPESTYPVVLPSGALFEVYQNEQNYVLERSNRYTRDFDFKNASDLACLDQIIQGELLIHRWMIWQSSQKDYWGEPVNEIALARQAKDTSAEVRQLKSSLGIDKVTRDKERQQNSVDQYLANLLRRAKEFGQFREEQLDKALNLFNELMAKITLYNNTDEDDRRELNCSKDAIWEWIEKEAIPAYLAIDEHFRSRPDGQRHWIRDL